LRTALEERYGGLDHKQLGVLELAGIRNQLHNCQQHLEQFNTDCTVRQEVLLLPGHKKCHSSLECRAVLCTVNRPSAILTVIGMPRSTQQKAGAWREYDIE
jgi:hypothetical protein